MFFLNVRMGDFLEAGKSRHRSPGERGCVCTRRGGVTVIGSHVRRDLLPGNGREDNRCSSAELMRTVAVVIAPQRELTFHPAAAPHAGIPNQIFPDALHTLHII